MNSLGVQRWRARRVDAGFTLTEMVVILALVGIVGTIALTIILSVFRTQRTVMSRSDAQQQMQLAVDQVASEIRSADDVDSTNIVGGWELVSYTDKPGATATCTEWQYISNQGTLRSRTWPTDWRTSGGVTQWRTVATGLSNSDSPFAVVENSEYKDKVVKLSLASETGGGAVLSIQSAATVRRASTAGDISNCNERPLP